MRIAPFQLRNRSILPGYRLSMGIALFWLSLIVLFPLVGLLLYVGDLSYQDWANVLTNARVHQAFWVSISTSLVAALLSLIFGTLIAWVLTRYHFYGRALLDAVIDIPFALPTAIAGIALAAVYAPDGALGQYLYAVGIEITYNKAGIVLALTFIGLPFVVRNVEPILIEMDHEVEEAALSLGATRIQCFVKVIAPQLVTALISGFALAFARGLGEYGSVIFLAGNVPYVSEIVPLAIVTALESYDLKTATIMAVLMLILSFFMLYVLNALQQRHHAKGAR